MSRTFSTSTRLILLVVVLSSCMMAVGTLGLIGVYRSNDALQTVYADRTVPMHQLTEIQRLMQRTWLIIAIGGQSRSAAFVLSHEQDIRDSLAAVHRLHASYLLTYLTPEESVLAAKFNQDLKRVELDGILPALAAVKAGDFDEALRIQLDIMVPASVSYRTHLQELTQLQLSIANGEYEAAKRRFETYRLASILSMTGGLAFALLFGGFLVRNIVRSKTAFEQSLQAQRDLERQLQQSQKVQALGELTGGIAHDFNNILAAVLGYANLALDRCVTDPHAKLALYLREIVTASERARDLVAKMLTFARTEPSPNMSLVAPSAVVREVHALIAPSMPSSIELVTRIDDDAQILADACELTQVLVNLMINARDAILAQGHEHGRIGIVVRKARVEDQLGMIGHRRLSGSFLAIDVSDSGAGIAPEHLARVFDPFFTTKDVGKGTGLGLSMVQGIMTRAGGEILLQSTPGAGTRFQLLFPLAVGGAASAPALAAGHAPVDGHGQVAWIVDDESALSWYLADLLSGWGYQTRSFLDPQALLQAFRAAPPKLDVLITDLTMPGLSGAELIREIRALDPDVPVIINTGFTDSAHQDLLSRLPNCRVLYKPVSSANLAAALAALGPACGPDDAV
jgi:signal transduction histidine kinase/CheY-like chemotaxis protein